MRGGLFAMAVVTLICLPGCSNDKRSNGHQANATLRVAYIENASCWPFFVAEENGLFERLGVDVDYVCAKDSSEALNALLAGKVDVSIENTYSVLFAIEARSPGALQLFLPCSETKTRYVSHLLVPIDSNISSPSEIKGKRIGTYTGATQLLTLRLFLKEYLQLDPEKDVKIIQVAPSLQGQALAAGQYDVLFTIEPFASAALAKGIARDVLPYARGKILDPFPAGACSVRTDVKVEKRESLDKLRDAMMRAAEYIERNPEVARRTLAKWTGLDAESSKYVRGYSYQGLDSFGTVERDRVQDLADMYYKGGIISKKIDAGRMFLDRAEQK